MTNAKNKALEFKKNPESGREIGATRPPQTAIVRPPKGAGKPPKEPRFIVQYKKDNPGNFDPTHYKKAHMDMLREKQAERYRRKK